MKINIDIDCSPQGARHFLGLPDLGPGHDLYIDQMKPLISQSLSADLLETRVRGAMPMGASRMGLWRQMVERMGGTGASR